MGCLGVHFAITKKQMDQLLAVAEDEGRDEDDADEAVMEVVSVIEEKWDRKHLFQTDKAWDAIHRCLTEDHTGGGRLDPGAGEPPLSLVILGGEALYHGDDYTVALVRPEEVRDVANALAGVTEAWMRERFFRLKRKQTKYDITEEEFEYTWGNFRGMAEFFAAAAKARRAVIFTADH